MRQRHRVATEVDKTLTARRVTDLLKVELVEQARAYKRQPIIEKRFSQLKTDFNVAPV